MPENSANPEPPQEWVTWAAEQRATPAGGVYSPRRGSDVEVWITSWRDRYPPGPAWKVLDDLLHDYRLRADTGLNLHADIADAGQFGGGLPW